MSKIFVDSLYTQYVHILTTQYKKVTEGNGCVASIKQEPVQL